MANRRMIAGDTFVDEFFGGLSFFERLLWIGLITAVADDQGRMMDNPALIRSNVFLYDQIQDSQVETTLCKIKVEGKIVRYVAGNKHLIQIVNWWKYQTPAWASPSKYAAPIGWVDRVKVHAPGNKVFMSNWDKAGGYVQAYVPGVDSALNDGDVNGNGKGDGKGEGEGKIAPPLPDIFTLYENEIGTITKTISDELTEAEKEYPAEWFSKAFAEAADQNKRSWAYVRAILKRWKVEGVGKNNGNGTGRKVTEVE